MEITSLIFSSIDVFLITNVLEVILNNHCCPDRLLGLGPLFGKIKIILPCRAAVGAVSLGYGFADSLNVSYQPFPHIVEQPHIIGILDVFRKHSRVNQHTLCLDDLAIY